MCVRFLDRLPGPQNMAGTKAPKGRCGGRELARGLQFGGAVGGAGGWDGHGLWKQGVDGLGGLRGLGGHFLCGAVEDARGGVCLFGCGEVEREGGRVRKGDVTSKRVQ